MTLRYRRRAHRPGAGHGRHRGASAVGRSDINVSPAIGNLAPSLQITGASQRAAQSAHQRQRVASDSDGSIDSLRLGHRRRRCSSTTARPSTRLGDLHDRRRPHRRACGSTDNQGAHYDPVPRGRGPRREPPAVDPREPHPQGRRSIRCALAPGEQVQLSFGAASQRRPDHLSAWDFDDDGAFDDGFASPLTGQLPDSGDLSRASAGDRHRRAHRAPRRMRDRGRAPASNRAPSVVAQPALLDGHAGCRRQPCSPAAATLTATSSPTRGTRTATAPSTTATRPVPAYT